MLDRENLFALAKAAATAPKSAPVAYSYEGNNYSTEQVNEALRSELNELIGTPALWRQNKNVYFELIERIITDTVPNDVKARYDSLAEVARFAQGDKPIFRRRVNARTRAKQFVTRVGLAGVYEVFKLGGSESFEIQTSAIGGAAQIGFEEFLDGRADFAELVQIVRNAMEEMIQLEVGQALIAGVNQLPAANQVNNAGFDEVEFDRLLTIADSYGSGNATIYCDQMFAAQLQPAKIEMYSDAMKEEIWRNGFFKTYKNHNVVIIPNGVADETNSELQNDPGYVWIVPATGMKPVVIAFEGDTHTREEDNHDWSHEIHTYQKVGVAALMTNDICVYHDTSLTKELN